MRLGLLSFAIALMMPSAGFAQVADGSLCTTAGQTAMGSNPNGFMNLLYCNGNTWVPASVKPGGATGTCDSSYAGVIRYQSAKGFLQFCDGTGWQNISYSAASTASGYFVLSNTGHDGNLGGLSGANTMCRNELSAGSWLGKPGSLDTNKIFAFLCDGSTCQDLSPNVQYIYASIYDATAGGASFITDSRGYGPNDTLTWAVPSKFGNNAPRIWTARTYLSESKWGGSYYQNCTSWTSNSSSDASTVGNSTDIGHGRYSAYTNPCNYGGGNRLICFVNP